MFYTLSSIERVMTDDNSVTVNATFTPRHLGREIVITNIPVLLSARDAHLLQYINRDLSGKPIAGRSPIGLVNVVTGMIDAWYDDFLTRSDEANKYEIRYNEANDDEILVRALDGSHQTVIQTKNRPDSDVTLSDVVLAINCWVLADMGIPLRDFIYQAFSTNNQWQTNEKLASKTDHAIFGTDEQAVTVSIPVATSNVMSAKYLKAGRSVPRDRQYSPLFADLSKSYA